MGDTFNKVAELFADGPLETVVWLRTTNEQLRDLAALLGPNPEPPEPEPGRTLLALTFGPDAAAALPADWTLAPEGGDEPKSLAYAQAMVAGVGLAALAAARGADAGIPVTVYAMRVQPVGAEFPSNYQYGSDQAALPSGERG
jgi:hypothetical protein